MDEKYYDTFEYKSNLSMFKLILKYAYKNHISKNPLRILYNLFSLKINEPIFIIGSPRSGTTFLGKVIENVPSISYQFEPPMTKYYSKLVYNKEVNPKEADIFYKLIYTILHKFINKNGTRFAEKTPRNVFIAEFLYKIFPKAKFIYIYRDGRDVACSLLNKPWHLKKNENSMKREPGGYLYGPFPHYYIEKDRHVEYYNTSDLHRCIWVWKNHAKEGIELEKNMPHDVFFKIKYEELIGNPEKVVKNMLWFLNEYDDYSHQMAMEKARSANLSSIGRWNKELDEAQLEVIVNEAEDELRYYSYI